MKSTSLCTFKRELKQKYPVCVDNVASRKYWLISENIIARYRILPYVLFIRDTQEVPKTIKEPFLLIVFYNYIVFASC